MTDAIECWFRCSCTLLTDKSETPNDHLSIYLVELEIGRMYVLNTWRNHHHRNDNHQLDSQI